MARRNGRAQLKIDAKWRKLLCCIPGYDPIATATTGDSFDEDAAQRPIDFFAECLHHVEGEKAGQPFILEPWQAAIIANTFGWKRKDGTRRYRTVFIFVPRKNGKTTLAAGIILFILFCDPEPGAKVYGAAGEYQQASLVFHQAAGMVDQDDELSARCKVYRAQAKAITIEDQYRAYRVISADKQVTGKNKHGFNPHAFVVDELHTQNETELVDALETAVGARKQPLGIYITTSDYAREDSVCNEKHAYASNVRDGIVSDPSFLPVIYEAAVDDNWKSPKVWAKANPNLDISLGRDFLRAQCQKAIEIPRFENTFKRLHLNIRTEQDVRWLPMDHWDACACSVDMEALKGSACAAGIDLAKTADMTALVLCFKRPDDKYAVLPFFFMPAEGTEKRSRRDRVDYAQWAKEGLLTLTPGNVTDYEFVKQRMRELRDHYDVAEWAYDPWNASQFAIDMQNEGATMVEFRQGDYSMNEPSKEFERLVEAHLLEHPNHPILNWHARNVSIKEGPTGNIKPVKTARGDGKRVDGIIAAIMALGRARTLQDRGWGSISERGVVFV